MYLTTRARLVILAAIAIPLLIWGLTRLLQAPMSDEDQVVATLQAISEAASQADIAGVMDPIAEDYSDASGLDAQTLRLFLFSQFQKRGPIANALGDIQVRVEGDTAEASFNAVLADGIDLESFDLRPDSVDSWRFNVRMRRVDGDWLLVWHERRGMQPEDLFGG